MEWMKLKWFLQTKTQLVHYMAFIHLQIENKLLNFQETFLGAYQQNPLPTNLLAMHCPDLLLDLLNNASRRRM